MAVNMTYDTAELMELVPSLKGAARWLRDRYFAPRIIRFDTRKIAFDRMLEDLRVAPYVSPKVAGVVRKERGMTTLFYEAPYIKEKSEIAIEDAFDRGPAETFGGTKSPLERRDDMITKTLAEHYDRITRAEELQAAELLRTGSLTVSGHGFDQYVVSYNRAAGQTIALSGGTRWDQTTSDPLANLQTWSLQTQRAEYGGPVSEWVMDPVAYGLFINRLTVRGELAMLNTQVRGNASALQLGPSATQQFLAGSINGMLIWVYQDQYENAAGSIVNVLPNNTVIGISGNAQGMIGYGAVKVAGVLAPLDRYPRLIGGPNQDPSDEFLITEAAPLCALRRPNATIAVTVA